MASARPNAARWYHHRCDHVACTSATSADKLWQPGRPPPEGNDSPMFREGEGRLFANEHCYGAISRLAVVAEHIFNFPGRLYAAPARSTAQCKSRKRSRRGALPKLCPLTGQPRR